MPDSKFGLTPPASESCPPEPMAKESWSVPSRLQVTVSPSASVALKASPMSLPPAVFSATLMVTWAGPPMTGGLLGAVVVALSVVQLLLPAALVARTRTEYSVSLVRPVMV